MKIAVLTSLYPSAVRPNEGIFAERRWLRIRDRGHEVAIVQPLPVAPPIWIGRPDWVEISRMAGIEDRSGLRVERPRYFHWPGRSRSNANAFAKCGLRRILELDARPDVIVADYAWPASAVAPLIEGTEIACVVSGRGSDVNEVAGEADLGKELARYLLSAGHWCGVSQNLVSRMDEIAGIAGRGVLVPNGIDMGLFRPRNREEARQELHMDQQVIIVLVVGNLVEAKDPLLACATFSVLRDLLESPARQVFIGRGPLAANLRKEAKRRGVNEYIQLIGEVEPKELTTWYAAADLLLLCSRREGRPNVVLEALACGLPVLATDAGGTGELLAGLDGMLARTREPAQLAALAATLLSKPRDSHRLSSHVSGFSWDQSSATLEGILMRAVQAKRTARG